MAIIAASILDADFSRFEFEVSRVAEAGVGAFSIDFIDGHFAARITFVEYVMALVRNWIDLPVEAGFNAVERVRCGSDQARSRPARRPSVWA